MCADAARGTLADANYKVQKMIPLPKLGVANVSYNQFRGIAVSSVTRTLYTIAILHLLRRFLPVAQPFTFAYAPNRSANTLQVALGTSVQHMLHWEGNACVAKLDISAAFDSVLLQLIATALHHHGLLVPFIDLVLQSQRA
eukprot:68555-Amphidinium_carterae.1